MSEENGQSLTAISQETTITMIASNIEEKLRDFSPQGIVQMVN